LSRVHDPGRLVDVRPIIVIVITCGDDRAVCGNLGLHANRLRDDLVIHGQHNAVSARRYGIRAESAKSTTKPSLAAKSSLAATARRSAFAARLSLTTATALANSASLRHISLLSAASTAPAAS